MTETLTLRVPAENESFLFSYGETGTLTQAFNIPERILGIDRDFWECFSDTSNVDTVWEEKQGIGCAAWAEETVRKWDQSSQVRVFVNGPDSFADEFKDVLNALSPVVNLRFEWVGAESNADITAYIGIAIPELESQGVFCIDFEAFGCANTEFDPRSGEILGSEIIIYNLWPDLGVDFDDFSDGRRSDFRSAMIHEAVHALARMIHRTELLSIMNISVHESAVGQQLRHVQRDPANQVYPSTSTKIGASQSPCRCNITSDTNIEGGYANVWDVCAELRLEL